MDLILLTQVADRFSNPADLLRDTAVDDEGKWLILRLWQQAAVKTENPCDDAIRGPLLTEIGEALKALRERRH
jgi:hypothetical protein